MLCSKHLAFPKYLTKGVLVQDDFLKVLPYLIYMALSELQKIGLTEGEISVYEALLALGESTKTGLAKKAGVSPSNIYDITNRLLQKGLISKVEKNGIAHFSPASPQRLLDFLENKKREIDEEKNLVSSLLPRLMSEFRKTETETNVEVFYGWNGMKTVWGDMLNECESGDENLVFGAGQGENARYADLFFSKYSRVRAKKGIKTKIIFNEDVRQNRERVSFFLGSKMCDVKFMSPKTLAEMLLYKQRACLIILSKQPLVIRISGKEVSDSFKQYFKMLWKVAKR